MSVINRNSYTGLNAPAPIVGEFGVRQEHAKRKTKEELAKSVGVKQYTVSRMLSGSPFPTVEQLALIANALDVSLYCLIGIQE